MGGSVRFVFEDLSRSRGFSGLRRGSVCGHFHKWIVAVSTLKWLNNVRWLPRVRRHLLIPSELQQFKYIFNCSVFRETLKWLDSTERYYLLLFTAAAQSAACGDVMCWLIMFRAAEKITHSSKRTTSSAVTLFCTFHIPPNCFTYRM